ncbi:hypothetical protein GEMRC1_011173 [Eukaryota sp. GEM-RC1]
MIVLCSDGVAHCVGGDSQHNPCGLNHKPEVFTAITTGDLTGVLIKDVLATTTSSLFLSIDNVVYSSGGSFLSSQTTEMPTKVNVPPSSIISGAETHYIVATSPVVVNVIGNVIPEVDCFLLVELDDEYNLFDVEGHLNVAVVGRNSSSPHVIADVFDRDCVVVIIEVLSCNSLNLSVNCPFSFDLQYPSFLSVAIGNLNSLLYPLLFDYSCPPYSCHLNSECIDGTCSCIYPYYGSFCSDKACFYDCHDRGGCNHGECVCNEGFGGEFCEVSYFPEILNISRTEDCTTLQCSLQLRGDSLFSNFSTNFHINLDGSPISVFRPTVSAEEQCFESIDDICYYSNTTFVNTTETNFNFVTNFFIESSNCPVYGNTCREFDSGSFCSSVHELPINDLCLSKSTVKFDRLDFDIVDFTSCRLVSVDIDGLKSSEFRVCPPPSEIHSLSAFEIDLGGMENFKIFGKNFVSTVQVFLNTNLLVPKSIAFDTITVDLPKRYGCHHITLSSFDTSSNEMSFCYTFVEVLSVSPDYCVQHSSCFVEIGLNVSAAAAEYLLELASPSITASMLFSSVSSSFVTFNVGNMWHPLWYNASLIVNKYVVSKFTFLISQQCTFECVHGYCFDGICYCDEGFEGEHCDLFSCPSDCLSDQSRGICNNGTCVCNDPFFHVIVVIPSVITTASEEEVVC